MNPLTLVKILCLASCAWALSACSQSSPSAQPPQAAAPTIHPGDQTKPNMNPTHLNITIGALVFTATLEDNPSTAAFKAMLPLKINMSELNRKEKFYDLSSPLPVNARPFDTIESGALMLYGDNTLVLFYTHFANTYTYTKLGQVNNPLGLAEALGKGDAVVAFDLAK